MTKPPPIPEGYGTVTPWVVTPRRIGGSIIMMFDSPFAIATPGLLRLYVEDGDAVFRRAVAAGATPVTQLTELAWGDRVGRVRDPLGNIWWIQERVDEPAPDEVARRLDDPKFTEGMEYLQSTLAVGFDAS